MTIGSRFATLAAGLMMVHTQGLWAAEIKVLSIPLRAPLEEIRSEFERATGHKLLIKYGLPLNCEGRSTPARSLT